MLTPHAIRRLAAHPPLPLAVGPMTAEQSYQTEWRARAAAIAAQDATRRTIANCAPKACPGCPNAHACQYGAHCRWPKVGA